MRDKKIAVIDSYGVTNLREDGGGNDVGELWSFGTSGGLRYELHVGANVSRARLCDCFVPRNDGFVMDLCEDGGWKGFEK